jgi:hypothetical protein
MRITKIEIDRFKGFYDTCVIDLHRGCKNLLVYGENGSGKSSLFQALQLFLDSGVCNLDFNQYRNIFSTGPDGRIRISFRKDERSGEQTYEWSPTHCETNQPIILDASKSKGFLDYKSLLETYFLNRDNGNVNLFPLLIRNLLANTVNDISQNTFLQEWSALERAIPSKHIDKKLELFEGQIQSFNQGFQTKLTELLTGANEILKRFSYDVQITGLEFQGIGYNYAKAVKDRQLTGQSVYLKVNFFGRTIDRHHVFLNEAKLSAIALSIYLSALRLVPVSAVKILAFDDVLIGLDMSNRLPVLEILEHFFPDHQIILTTYDLNWFEMVRLRTANKSWKYVEFFSSHIDGHEMPIYVENQDYLLRAKEHLADKDYKACAVYVRTAFESQLKKLAKKKKLKVVYQPGKPHSSQDFWGAALGEKLFQQPTIDSIETYRKFVLNPLSHAQLTNVYHRELQDAIDAVHLLSQEVDKLL